jgi:hypothetical protein
MPEDQPMSQWGRLSEWAVDLVLDRGEIDYLRRHADHGRASDPILEGSRVAELLELHRLRQESARDSGRE